MPYIDFCRWAVRKQIQALAYQHEHGKITDASLDLQYTERERINIAAGLPLPGD